MIAHSGLLAYVAAALLRAACVLQNVGRQLSAGSGVSYGSHAHIAQQVAVAVPYFVLQFAIAAAACALLSRNSLSVLLSPLARLRPRLLQHSQHC